MTASRTAAAARPRSGQILLGIYLNDHLAGATGGVELARRTAASHRGSEAGERLEQLAAELAADRASLVTIMTRLGIPARRYKAGAAWLAEKGGRLKFNGSLWRRSPLSGVVELELLRLGVEGKAAGWRTLQQLAGQDTRLDMAQLAELLARAQRQAETLEQLRVRAVITAFADTTSR